MNRLNLAGAPIAVVTTNCLLSISREKLTIGKIMDREGVHSRSLLGGLPSRREFMTYVVNESCIKCKLMDCVEVCPVDCFYEGENMLVIHPDECIDCGFASRNVRSTRLSRIPSRAWRSG